MPSIEHLETLSSDELVGLLPTFRESDPREAIAILKLISDRARLEEDFDGMLHWQSEIFSLAQDLKDISESADALYHQGFALTILDRDAEATDYYLNAKKLYQDLFDTESLIYCLEALIENSIFILNGESRLSFSLEALDLARINDDVNLVGVFALKVAEALEAIGLTPLEDITDESYEIAVMYSEEAYQSFLNVGDVEKIIEALCDITHYLTVLLRYQSAFERISEAESRIPDLESGPESKNEIIGRIYKLKGILQGELGRPVEAIEDFKKSIGHLPAEEESYDLGVVYWRMANILNDLERNDEALDAIEKGMAITRRDNPRMYYRCMQLQVHILYVENREREALFISRGAMLEYENSNESEIQSHLYFAFILNAALCLLDLKRYEEMIEVLGKVTTISDYLVPINRSVRVDYLRSLAFVYLHKFDDAKEILDALLDFDELDESDEDIGCAYLLRSVTVFGSDKVNAKLDLQRGIEILKSQGKIEHAENIMDDFPELQELV